MQLVLQHEYDTGLKFDLVILTRLDLCPCQREPLVYSALALPPGKMIRVGIMGDKKLNDHRNFRDSYLSNESLQGRVAHLPQTPRADDTILLGTAEALHRLSLSPQCLEKAFVCILDWCMSLSWGI